ncbi:HA1F protein, partial [Rhinopomastus cyanomelas]|nr:HA1F protein [Rhinopomastus cyanomelas]
LKDGELRDQDTERGSVAPNPDGTYSTWASVEARPEDRDKYRCRVEHASLAEPGLFAPEPEPSLLAVVLGALGAVSVFVAAVAGLVFWKIRRNEATKAKGYHVA